MTRRGMEVRDKKKKERERERERERETSVAPVAGFLDAEADRMPMNLQQHKEVNEREGLIFCLFVFFLVFFFLFASGPTCRGTS